MYLLLKKLYQLGLIRADTVHNEKHSLSPQPSIGRKQSKNDTQPHTGAFLMEE